MSLPVREFLSCESFHSLILASRLRAFHAFTLQGKPPENDAQDFPASLTKVLEKEEEIKIKTFSRGKLGKLYRQ